MSMEKLLSPKTVAIVGASEKEGFGGDTCRNVLSYANPDNVYFVNPKRDEVFGRPCCHSIADIPVDIDLVVLCTPQKTIEPLLREAAAKGAGGAVVYASGYSEVGTPEGVAAEESLKALCAELDISLMGPNCAGFINYIDRVVGFAFISDERDRTGSVGFVSQSGQLCLSFMDNKSMRFSYSISSGNSSVVTMEDYLDYLIDDAHTKVVGLYLEGVTQPEKFEKALRKAAQMRKPVVVLKAGRSEKGSKVAASHTGSLSGADVIYDALFQKFGVIRVNDAEELLATTQLFATLPTLPRQAGLASINLSGGETGICADMGEMAGIEYPDFEEETLEKLRALLPSYASPANPLDTTATISYDAEVYASVLQTVMDDPNVGLVVIGYTLLHEIADPCIHHMARGIESVVKNGRAKPMVMLPFFENSRNPEYLDKLNGLGVPVLPPPTYGFAALRHLVDFIGYDPDENTLELAIPEKTEATGRRTLSEFESASILREYGVRTPEGSVVDTPEAAAKTADSLGYPVVMKIASADIAHKSDMGGVALNIKSADEAREAFERIMGNARTHAPDARVDGVYIQKMLPPGVEVIIGVNSDPQFGPAVLVGLGGIFVEIFRDTSLRPAPFGKDEARRMLKRLKAFPLFNGYRGQEALDVEALAETIAGVARLAAERRNEIVELDINPVFVYGKGKGICAADALVVVKD
ncbi:acetate--CoA ligase family protein [Oceanidesulfovibrio marinus]|uniref:CoA-binding protein n=1 Tax=Oceanidesulfovibrio marinus TaxID=370038 RepID=A0A6P1ZH67_9BACT|nr:acetate--CoA ligase family protein [Oceanidesulfovibrio marinus]TVM33728.1 CoA-binding protein [Oceanidesulfovibrio marinus]